MKILLAIGIAGLGYTNGARNLPALGGRKAPPLTLVELRRHQPVTLSDRGLGLTRAPGVLHRHTYPFTLFRDARLGGGVMAERGIEACAAADAELAVDVAEVPLD